MTAPVATTAAPDHGPGAGAAQRRPVPRRPSGPRPPVRPDPRWRPAPAATQPAPAPALPPTGRLGLLWGVALLGSTLVAPALVAVVVAPVAAVAAASLARRHEAVGLRRVVSAAAGAAVVPAAAIGGWVPAVVAGGLVAAALAALAAGSGSGDVARVARGALDAVAPGAAGASLVLSDHGSIGTALALALAICLFDLANYVMGTGASGGALGAGSGMVAVGVLALLAAGAINPPFSGSRPWVAFGILAVLAPLGVRAGRRLSGGARLPALRRLDSLLLAGPAWVVTSHLLLR